MVRSTKTPTVVTDAPVVGAIKKTVVTKKKKNTPGKTNAVSAAISAAAAAAAAAVGKSSEVKPMRVAGEITDLKYLLQDISKSAVKRTFYRSQLASIRSGVFSVFRKTFARFLVALTTRLLFKVQHDRKNRITDRDVDWVIQSFGRRLYGSPEEFKSLARQKSGMEARKRIGLAKKE